MREAAQAYCSLIEDSDEEGHQGDGTAYAHQLLTALSDAVAAAVRLPEIEPSDADSPVSITQEQWRACYQRIGRLTGPWAGYYWEASYPFAIDEAAASVGLGDLSDDLADIWRDLKDGLLALEAGMSIDDVHWEWRHSYWAHWGHHAAGAMRALLLRLSDRGNPPPPALGWPQRPES